MKLRKKVFFLLCIVASMNFGVRILDPLNLYGTSLVSNFGAIIGIMFVLTFIKKKSKKNL